MMNLRKYGSAPWDVAVLHGGPGASGEMAPVARELAPIRGVLEPLQTASTIEGQITELKAVLEKEGDSPLTVIGWSWGAWLGFIFASRYPSLVKKIILIGSGPFKEKFARNIMQTRLKRMNIREKSEVLLLIETMDGPSLVDKDETMMRFGKIISKADSYDPMPQKSEILECRYDIYNRIWPQADSLRSSGRLLQFGRKIRCPVVAIHGDYDPHPYEGVLNPLSRILKDFCFILLEKCGHQPWIEKRAKDEFFAVLKNEIAK
jgi:pimeloyl-ACP methyl ester carboxylesterase